MAFTIHFPAASSRLSFRKLRPEDAFTLFEYTQHKQNLKYLSFLPHQSIQDARDFIDQANLAWEVGSKYDMAITWKNNSQELIGTLAIINEGGRVFIGYNIHPNQQGKGVATEATQWAIQWLQRNTEVYRIYAFCDAQHEASKAVLRKAGMIEEGKLHQWMVFPNQGNQAKDCTFFWAPPSN